MDPNEIAKDIAEIYMRELKLVFGFGSLKPEEADFIRRMAKELSRLGYQKLGTVGEQMGIIILSASGQKPRWFAGEYVQPIERKEELQARVEHYNKIEQGMWKLADVREASE